MRIDKLLICREMEINRAQKVLSLPTFTYHGARKQAALPEPDACGETSDASAAAAIPANKGKNEDILSW